MLLNRKKIVYINSKVYLLENVLKIILVYNPTICVYIIFEHENSK